MELDELHMNYMNMNYTCSDSHTEEVGSWEHVILMLFFLFIN